MVLLEEGVVSLALLAQQEQPALKETVLQGQPGLMDQLEQRDQLDARRGSDRFRKRSHPDRYAQCMHRQLQHHGMQ